MIIQEQIVQVLAISYSSFGNLFSYSPPKRGDTIEYFDDTNRTFVGPRTVLPILASATASIGQILPVQAPYQNSSYLTTFFGPIVECSAAGPHTVESIDKVLQDDMNTVVGTATQMESAYLGFVPSYNDSGDLVPLSMPRFQTPSNSTNQLWITFLRYVINPEGLRTTERQYQVCKLHNASFDVHLEWRAGSQNITLSYDILEEVEYPTEGPGETTNIVQHAYSAYFWALADQLVGKFAWFENSNQTRSVRAPEYGIIQSPIQHSSLLGSSDLDPYFDLNERGLNKSTAIAPPKGQRLRDKQLARNRTLDILITELSVNFTVTMLTNELLT